MKKKLIFLMLVIFLLGVGQKKAHAAAGCWTAAAPNFTSNSAGFGGGVSGYSFYNIYVPDGTILSHYWDGGGYNYSDDYNCNNGVWDINWQDGGGGSLEPLENWTIWNGYTGTNPAPNEPATSKWVNLGIRIDSLSLGNQIDTPPYYPAREYTYTTSNNVINLSGIANDDNTAVSKITWANDRGGSGIATGTNNWTINNIPLQLGVNKITLVPWDSDNWGILVPGPDAGPDVHLSVTFIPAEVAATGICGASDNQSFESAPNSGLCRIGIPSTPVGSGPWTWTCSGGGEPTSCSANRSAAAACTPSFSNYQCNKIDNNICNQAGNCGKTNAITATCIATNSCSGTIESRIDLTECGATCISSTQPCEPCKTVGSWQEITP